MTFKKSGPKITASDISAFEKKCGLKLPAAYRKFLLSHNGGQPSECLLEFTGVDECENELCVSMFYSICRTDKKDYDLEKAISYWRESERLPKRVIPVGEDIGGNLICLSLGKKDPGCVYFWDHEFELEFDDDDEQENLALLSEDFREFIDMLTADPDAADDGGDNDDEDDSDVDDDEEDVIEKPKKKSSKKQALSKTHKQLKEQDIVQLEEKTEIRLPKQYRDFLLKYNGGVPALSQFTTRSGRETTGVKKFLPLANIKDDNLLEEIEGITQAGQIPSNLIPVAVTYGDERVVISHSGSDVGKVYYWSWDMEPERAHKPSYKYIFPVADSFNEFFEGLAEDEDD